MHVGKDIRNEQQIMVFMADSMIALYTAEASLARTIKVGADHAQAAVRAAIVRLVLHDAEEEIGRLARASFEHVAPDYALEAGRKTLEGLLVRTPENVVALKRRIAEHVNAAGRYDLY